MNMWTLCAKLYMPSFYKQPQIYTLGSRRVLVVQTQAAYIQ